MNTLSGLRSYDTVLTLDGLSQFDSSIQTQALLIDGSNAMVADLDAGGHVVKNLDIGQNSSDSCTFGQMTTADNLRLLLSGGVMTGTVSSTTVTTPFDFSNPNGTIIAKLSAGTASVNNACTLQMASNSSSTLEFRDNASNVKAALKYNFGSPGSLNMIVNGVTALSTSNTQATFAVPISMSNVATPLTAVNTGGALNLSLSAGTAISTQPCSIKMSSNSQSYLEFTDVAAATKAWVRYLASGGGSIDLTVANNPMVTLTSSTVTLGGTTQLGGNRITGLGSPTVDSDAATRLFVTDADNLKLNLLGGTMGGGINMGNFQISGLANGTGQQNAVTVSQTLLRNGVNPMTGALDMNTINKIINLATPTLGTDAATKTYVDDRDAAVTNNSVQKTGSIMSGTLTINNIQTCLQATHTASGLFMRLEGGSSSTPNVTIIEMTAGLYGGIDFHDYAGAILGHIRYDTQNTPDQIDFKIGAISPLKLREASVIISQPLAMSTKRITGLQAATATDHAVNKGQMDTADDLRLKHDGSVAMTGALNMGTAHKITNLSPGTTNLDGVNYQQITQSSIPITAWRTGETISRYFMSPALGDNLVTNPSTVAGAANTILLDTGLFYATAIGNRLLFKFGCECNAPGSGTDNFDIVLELGPTPNTQTFRYVLGPSSGYRVRSLLLETMYIAENVGSVSVKIRIYNYGNETITTNQTNWHFSAEEIKV
jgi:hypothetical protein